MISTQIFRNANPLSISSRCMPHAAVLPPAEFPSTQRRPVFPLTVVEQREAEYKQRLREQKKYAAQMKCDAPIFTAANVETMSFAEIAKLLNDCWYDLVRTEKRLLTNRDYDKFRRQSRL